MDGDEGALADQLEDDAPRPDPQAMISSQFPRQGHNPWVEKGRISFAQPLE